MKCGDARRRNQHYSLAEDEAILERVLPGLHKYKLHNLVLHTDESLENFATALGRPNKGHCVAERWAHCLQPWIMQHYAGTSNLDIRMTLVNHLAENYPNRESIDWEAIAEKSEFAGNTATSLKQALSYNLNRTFRTVLNAMRKEQIKE